MEPKIVIFGAPSGVGKSAITNALIEKYPQFYKRFPSVASRPMRHDESQGNPYIFVTNDEFEQKIKTGEVFEYTQIHGDYRGMSEDVIKDFALDGKIIVNDVDYIGVEALRRKYGKNVISFFLYISKEEVEKRLQSRGDDLGYIKFRISNYEMEMETSKHYDHMIENRDKDVCVENAHKIIQEFFG